MSTNVNSVGIAENVQQFVVYAVVDPANIAADGGHVTASVSLDGVGIGDHVQAVAPYDGQATIIGCVASGEGTVDMTIFNGSGDALNLGSGTWKFIVTRAG